MKNIKFYNINERFPKHGEEIFKFRYYVHGPYNGFEPIYDKIEYSYEEYIDDEFTGTSISYNENDTEELPENFKLIIRFDGYTIQESQYEHFHYVPVDELYNILGI